MGQFMKVPIGEEPEWGKVAVRGDAYNIWWSVATHPTEYEVLSEGEAQVEGLKMKPGRMMSSEVTDTKNRIQSDYGIDISTESLTVDGDTITLETFLRDYTMSVPDGWHHPRKDPFDVRGWE